MELTPKLDENYRLEDLDSDWKLATLYTAFLAPKSQQEAIKLIYRIRTIPGKRAPKIHHPVQWITDTREILMEQGYLIRVDQKLKGSVMKANIEPIVSSLIAAGTEDCTDPVTLDGVRAVLDSSWFRDFFSYDHLHSPIEYKNGQIYEPYQNIMKENPSGARLEITSLKNRMFQLLSEIGYYSHNLRYLYKRVMRMPKHRYEDPSFNDLIGGNDFDSLCSRISEEIPPNFIEFYRESAQITPLSTMVSLYPERLMRKLLDEHAALCMPTQVSILLRSAPCLTAMKPLDCGYIQRGFMKKWKAEYPPRELRNEKEIL